MISFFKNIKLTTKISSLGVGSVLITALALMALAVWQSRQYNDLAQREVDKLIDSDLDHIALGVYNLVKTVNDVVQQQVNHNLNVARLTLANAGGVKQTNEIVTWTASNQFTYKIDVIQLPKMVIGGKWLGQNTDSTIETPVVDEIVNLVGDHATIFQRMNEEGDMLRIATTVLNEYGKRAIGTYIPAIDTDGLPNPVISAVLKGETYHGRAYVVNAWYITAYEAIRNHKGDIVGMLYVGVKQGDIEVIMRDTILQTKVGRSGYVFVLEGKGEGKGRYIFSQFGERDGENIWFNQDSDHSYMVQSIINKAINLQPGELATERYRWQNPEDPEPRWKIARLTYFEPWDWVIGASVYEDELQNYRYVLSDGRVRMISSMALTGFLIILLIGSAGIGFAWTFTHPVRLLTQTVETITQGNLNQSVNIKSRDEIGILADAFNRMISQLKETILALRHSEQRFRSLIENTSDIITVMDRDGIIRYASPSIERVLGYTSESLIGKSVFDLLHPDDIPRIIKALNELLQKPDYSSLIEFRFRHNDNSWHVFEVVSVNRLEDPAVVGIVSNARDVSERRRLQETMIESTKLASLGTLAAGVAHELNSPLQVITGISERAVYRIKKGEVDVNFLTQNLEAINRNGWRCADIIRSLLSFARPSAGQIEAQDFNALILDTLLLIEHQLKSWSNITIKTKLAPDLPALPCNRNQIAEVLINLLTNARDAMPRGGEVIICTSYKHDSDFLTLRVVDSGTGIPKNIRERIFDPFFSTKPVGQGTGLGLSIVSSIVHSYGGEIIVEDMAPSGTAFVLNFSKKGPIIPISFSTENPLMYPDGETINNIRFPES